MGCGVLLLLVPTQTGSGVGLWNLKFIWGWLGFRVWGVKFWGLGFRNWGLGFGVQGLGFGGLGSGVWGLGFGVWGLGFEV